MKDIIKIEKLDLSNLTPNILMNSYNFVILDGKASFSIDSIKYKVDGKILIMLHPSQFFCWLETSSILNVSSCKVEINNLLFKQFAQFQLVYLEEITYQEISAIFYKLNNYYYCNNSIIQSYIQLILALSLTYTNGQRNFSIYNTRSKEMEDFYNTLEMYFLSVREVSFYAKKFGLSVGAFNRKIKKMFGKSPTKLIHDRVVLEAKKMLYLTSKPVKEIASHLNFEDEFYFSRVFKKRVGISPKHFRDKIGCF